LSRIARDLTINQAGSFLAVLVARAGALALVVAVVLLSYIVSDGRSKEVPGVLKIFMLLEDRDG
jgi:Ca2+/H+ antiporter